MNVSDTMAMGTTLASPHTDQTIPVPILVGLFLLCLLPALLFTKMFTKMHRSLRHKAHLELVREQQHLPGSPRDIRTGATVRIITTSHQQLSIYVRVFARLYSTGLQGVLVCVHGSGRHSGGFGEMASLLNRDGVAVYAHDLQGQGLSEVRWGGCVWG